MQIDSVKQHLAFTSKMPPFFLFVGDGQYKAIISELKLLGVDDFVLMSDFCGDKDKPPDIDAMISHIESADANAKKLVVIGLGEYLALRGDEEAASWLSRLKDHNVGDAKVVLLLRGLTGYVSKLKADPRFDKRRYSVIERAEYDLSFTIATPSIGLPALLGFKTMLAELERGRCGNVLVSTAVNLTDALFAVQTVNNAYEGIVRYYVKNFSLPRSCGSDARWGELLVELSQNNGSFDAVFEKHGFNNNNNLESNFYARIVGKDYRNWLYFVCLKCKVDSLQNGYLRFALDKTDCFEGFIANVLNAIIEISHKDKRFAAFYEERKVLVEKFPESDIASFVNNNRRLVSESIYKLTDRTKVEREEIIAWVSKNGIVPQLTNIYPALSSYLQKYAFECADSDYAELLTEYFEAYKRQKLSNQLESDFLEKVENLAKPPRKYNHLPARDDILENIDKNGTFLYWLDALGVEFLSLIDSFAKKRGLSLNVIITRAELPTITSVNRNFFDKWTGAKNGTNGDKRLDDVKHEDAGGYDFTKNELPIHLAGELEIIIDVLERAATELAGRNYTRFLIVSDHGASRLAVLRRKEEKYYTDTVSKHSGRCCKLFEPHDLTFAAEENEHLVLVDYGRFKGSRDANVEVHGGASLEEVVVPVVQLLLKNNSITVTLVTDTVVADRNAGTEIELFFNSPVQDVTVLLNGKRYLGLQTDTSHYSVKLPDTKRAGNYLADVCAGDYLIGSITIKAQGKSGTVDDGFEDLF